MSEFWYRMYDVQYAAGIDESGNPVGSGRTAVETMKLRVISETPKGVWLDYAGGKKFVRAAARKQFACPTLEEAKISFRARKRRQIRILKAQLRRAERALRLVSEQRELAFEELFGEDIS
jgi:hypothetical protein